MKHPLTEEERARVRAAIADVEARTSGEIVPVLVDRSDAYDVAVWRGAAGAAVLGLAVALLVLQLYSGWGLGWLFSAWGTAIVALTAGTAGAFATAFVPALRRRLAGENHLAERVHDRALRAFVEEEVFDTRDRTGILLFVSLFEHRIEVVGDAGINRLVEEDEWVDVVDRVREGLRRGRLADGLIDALGRCGDLLERRGVEIRPDDTNELSDDVRFRREE